jgi:hypothetical protein
MAVGISCADHTTSSTSKSGTNFADKRRSVGIVRLRTTATEFSFYKKYYIVIIKKRTCSKTLHVYGHTRVSAPSEISFI